MQPADFRLLSLKVLLGFQLSPGGEEGEGERKRKNRGKIRSSRKEVSLRRLVPAPTSGTSQ